MIAVYKCGNCQHEYDVIEKYVENPSPRSCPQCMTETAIRQIAPANFRLYGAGVYAPNQRD